MHKIFNAIRNIDYRRGPSRVLGGIAGGLAAKLEVNPWAMRLIVLLSFLLPIAGPGLYLVVWLITPWQDGSIPLERMLYGGRRS